MNRNLINEVERVKSLMILEYEKIKLGTVSHPNVKVESDIHSDSVPKALIDDLQTAASNSGIVVTITTAKSDHDRKTKSGVDSRHYTGQAVDIAIIDGKGSGGASNSKNGSPEFREKGNKLKDELVKLGYSWNRESGNPKAVLWQTDIGGNHYNHLHVSNQSGESGADIDILSPSSEPESSNISPEEKIQLSDFLNILNQDYDGQKIGDLAGIFDEDLQKKPKGLFDVMRDFYTFWGMFNKKP
jgi:D-alanyl-D-alanine dipeptidase